MLFQIIRDAWHALVRGRVRSALTMLGIVWGIVTVTLLISYGSGFRNALVNAFNAFGSGAVICWPGQTSEQAGGQRAGQKVRFEQADVDMVKANVSLVRHACLETVKWVPVQFGDRMISTAVRGVCPEYGEMRNEVPSAGRWLSGTDLTERRRVAFIGSRARDKLFQGRDPVGLEVTVQGMRFTIIGTMERKLQFSNYFTSDDECLFIPYSTAGDLWDNKYGRVIVFTPVAPMFEKKAQEQVLATIAARQGFSPTDKKAIQMFGRQEFRPVIDGITIGLQVLLIFIGALTLGIGGVGVMNIMLVSVEERIKEIGLRRALGAKKSHIRLQFLSETMILMLLGGLGGVILAYLLAAVAPALPLLGPLFEDESGKGDIHLAISGATLLISTLVLLLVGVVSGTIPAMRAAKLDPVEALRYE